MLPIEIFKSHKVYCGKQEPQMTFTSSATTGMVQSRHYVEDIALYERAFTEAFRHFYVYIPSSRYVKPGKAHAFNMGAISGKMI